MGPDEAGVVAGAMGPDEAGAVAVTSHMGPDEGYYLYLCLL